MQQSRYAKYIKQAQGLGVKGVKVIPARGIVTAEWVRRKCQFGCGGYGRRLTCPPNSPTPEQTHKTIQGYHSALLIHDTRPAAIRRIVVNLEKSMFLDGYYKAVGVGSGPCNLCARCTKLCRYPDRARPSMEACGIDVFSTVRAHGFPIAVLKTTHDKPNYYGLVLIE